MNQITTYSGSFMVANQNMCHSGSRRSVNQIPSESGSNACCLASEPELVAGGCPARAIPKKSPLEPDSGRRGRRRVQTMAGGGLRGEEGYSGFWLLAQIGGAGELG